MKSSNKKIMIIILVALLLIGVAIGAVILFGGGNTTPTEGTPPDADTTGSSGGNLDNEGYTISIPDAEDYFEENSEVLSNFDAEESDGVLTEAVVCKMLAERGFNQYPITTTYSMEGEYFDDIEVSEDSDTKHPLYQTYYVTERGDYWLIYVINDSLIAQLIVYSYQYEPDPAVVLSESNSVVSYDNTTNRFYETIPHESVMKIQVVERLDSTTLGNLKWGDDAQ